MKSIIIACMLLMQSTIANISWENDFDKAKQIASTEHKYILLNFSGSDWCGPCMRLHQEVFESDAFIKLAQEKLVLLNADFPRLKKNQLSKEQQQKNDHLADKYNNAGVFPLTVLLNADGSFIKAWEGFPKENANEFVENIKAAANGVR